MRKRKTLYRKGRKGRKGYAKDAEVNSSGAQRPIKNSVPDVDFSALPTGKAPSRPSRILCVLCGEALSFFFTASAGQPVGGERVELRRASCRDRPEDDGHRIALIDIVDQSGQVIQIGA